MNTLDIALKVCREFSTERTKEYKNNELAKIIRTDWPRALRDDYPSMNRDIVPKASAGIGAWNAAPFMALLDQRITESPKKGYYPVFLYERGFKSFCLVLAQGADQLQSTFGTKQALQILRVRAPEISKAAGNWGGEGFSAGPFETYSRGNSILGRDADDPWSVSVAFGKRYFLNNPPILADFIDDIAAMLELYENVFREIGTSYIDQEDIAERLAASGELPKSGVFGLDGALKVDNHKNRERRDRNLKLVKDVKSYHGYSCQGCGIDLKSNYGEIGKDFIEAHHLTPLSLAPKEGKILTQADFAVLCPTCHRIIHRLGCPPLEELRQAINPELRNFHSDLTVKVKLV
jgi:5-methylcytosine-specific restriction protein A